jgi:hypothetical protein
MFVLWIWLVAYGVLVSLDFLGRSFHGLLRNLVG